MPLTEKGTTILANMKKQYGVKKGKEVFYASQNRGTIKGTHENKKTASALDLAYGQGFMDKCASFGVDPEALVKSALTADHYDPKTHVMETSDRVGGRIITRRRVLPKTEWEAAAREKRREQQDDIAEFGYDLEARDSKEK